MPNTSLLFRVVCSCVLALALLACDRPKQVAEPAAEDRARDRYADTLDASLAVPPTAANRGTDASAPIAAEGGMEVARTDASVREPSPVDAQQPESGEIEPHDAGPSPSADAAVSSPPAPDPEPTAPPAARPWPADCDQRQLLTGHAESRAGDTRPREIAPGGQETLLFYFDAEWSGDAQLVEARPVVDNRSVVHHWALWVLPNPRGSNGEIIGEPALDFEILGGELLMASGPGASDLQLPPDVGLQLGLGERGKLGLEVHYFNPGTETARDASGVELCVTTHKRPTNAAIHSLGRVNFQVPAHTTTRVMGTCRPANPPARVYVASLTPHMHRNGTRATLSLNRKSGEQLELFDRAYVYEEQRTYPFPSGTEVVLAPGDTLTTTCTFENLSDQGVSSGTQNENEMCIIFALAWPAGGLSNGLPDGLLLGVPTEVSCLVL